jgi:hypothetical protein
MSTTRTVATFIRHGTCSETLCNVVDRAFGQPLPIEEHACGPLAGGIMAHGYQCGQVWGSALAGGAEAYRVLGSGPQAEAAAILAAQRIVESFRALYHSIDCSTITGVDFRSGSSSEVVRYFKNNGVRCFRMAAQYAPVAFSLIDATLAEDHGEAPEPPVSCAAELARTMGASGQHIVMAAGLAGGVGLSGDACGALATAIWLLDINDRRQGADKVGFKNPRAMERVDRFIGETDSRFLCSEIVGRTFDGIDDHAAYLREGGCARILALLADQAPPPAETVSAL